MMPHAAKHYVCYIRYVVVTKKSGGHRSQPFSIRLGPAAQLLVSDEAHRLGRSRTAVVEELTEEAAKTRLFPGIGFRGRPRRAWVQGSGLDVWEVIELISAYGDEGELRRHHPLVTDRHLRLAKAYGDRFPDEVSGFRDANRRSLSELRALYPHLVIDE
jgi:hypothetical protein